MPLWLPAAFLGAIALESLLLGALLLWWSCRWLKLSPISMRRAFGTNLLLVLAGVVAQFIAALFAAYAASIDAAWQIALACALLALHVVAQCAIVAALLRAGAVKAFLAWLTATVPVFIIGIALAALCKGAMVEAFTIPTGAMAPTLQGEHADRVCQHCGFAFAVGLSERTPPQGVSIAQWQTQIGPAATFCPNCLQPDEVGVDVPTVKGDRVIVDKQVMPRRWELVVYRYPEDRNINFIKRLVGLPGETLEIVSGEVFIDGQWLQKAPATAQDLWLHVHDTAFRADSPAADEPGWRPAEEKSNWRQVDGRWTNDGGGRRDELVYVGPVGDRLAYNARSRLFDRRESRRFEVGDILVACDVTRFSGAGSLKFAWQFRGESAEIVVSPGGEVEIQTVAARMDEHERQRAAGKLTTLPQPGDRLGFAVRDGQAYLIDNDQLSLLLPFGEPDIETAKARLQEPAAPCRIALVADRCRVELSRIVLVRDIYYRGGDEDDDIFAGGLRGGLENPVTLGETEYFVMGDNAARSKDSRFYGDLQASDILGTARWIYWPRKRWHEFR